MPSILSAAERDTKFRDFALHSSMWHVVLYVCIPLALYQSLAQIFKIADSMMAAHISATSVSIVAYLGQINLMLSAIGTGLAIGAGVKISESYGAGDYDMVRRRVSTLFAVCALLGGGILLILIPTTPQFLRLAKTPEMFIKEGTRYFILELIGMVINFFNSIYIAVERARGNSKRILSLNVVVIVVKLSLTAIFVYVLHGGIDTIAIATIISQAALFLLAIRFMFDKNSAFSISVRRITFGNGVLKPMIHISIPVIVEKVAFCFGKVVVNSMSTIYNPLTVGALGISNNIGGFTTNPQAGFQEGGSSIISQSIGANEPKRALEAFRCVLISCIVIGTVLMSLSLVFVHQISTMFSGDNMEFHQLIVDVYRMEALGAVPLGIHAAVMSLLYGIGKTRLTLFMNVARVFVFRIPVLWYLQHFTTLGNRSVGVVMAVSNISTGFVAVIAGIFVVKQFKQQYNISNP